MGKSEVEWDGAAVRAWLESRVAAARSDQVAAERRGREGHGDCDVAAAEEMVCSPLLRGDAADAQGSFLGELKGPADRDEHVWRGVYDNRRFDRHVRAYVRKLARMAKVNDSFGHLRRYR